MRRITFNHDWTFWKDGEETKISVNLPHDAMILERRMPEIENGSGSGFFPGGKYVYEKRFRGTSDLAHQAVLVEFEGVYMDSEVYLNGEKMGGHMYGYTNFFVNLTGKIRENEENVLRVDVDNSKQPNSRWYTGSGIYRPVWLWIGPQDYIAPQSVKISTVGIHPAVIRIQSPIAVKVEVGNVAGEGTDFHLTISDAQLWSAEMPYLYTAHVTRGQDSEDIRFGIRAIAWSAEKGLQINGETVKLRGGCLHHDHGILGACAYDKSEYRRMKKLKEFGFNAVRISHHPAGKNLLEACDELGMYVMDESFDQWRRPKNKYDYSVCFDQEWEKDIRAMVEKDYNHPSVILYCIGNEIMDTGRSYGPEVAHMLTSSFKKFDGTRPVTIANNAPMSMVSAAMESFEKERNAEIGSLQINELLTAHPDLVKAFESDALNARKLEETVGKVFDQVDIAGQNYAHEFYAGMHDLRPDRILLSAETFPQRMASNWRAVMENPWVIGDFHWTAWDYLGETGVGLPVYGKKEAPFSKPYPCLTAACGSFDLNGNPETAAYYISILWGSQQGPYIAVRPVNHSGEDYTLGKWRLTDAIHSWTWKGCEGKTAEIIVYGSGAEVELLLNGESVNRKQLSDCKAEFTVPYQSGRLEAILYDAGGNETGRDTIETAGNGLRLSAQPEETEITADTNEIVYVPIEITDEKGLLDPQMEQEVTVTVQGVGTLLALGSAKPETEELFGNNTHHAWRGQLLAIVRSNGQRGFITVTAAAEGMKPVSSEIKVF